MHKTYEKLEQKYFRASVQKMTDTPAKLTGFSIACMRS